VSLPERGAPTEKCFLETLGESCEKTGWRVHAYVLMGNHHHLLAEKSRSQPGSGNEMAPRDLHTAL
jgi:REP element-mobilizing transposase RayT